MIEDGEFLFGEAFVASVPPATSEFLPGCKPGNAERVRYVSFDRSLNPPDLFAAVVDQVRPPLPKRGRAMLETVILTAPDDTSFYAIEYFQGADDPEAWRPQIELGAAQLGLITARIDGADLALSDGRRFQLLQCKVEHDLSKPRPPLASALGAKIYCGKSFEGRLKSGSAFEGVLLGLADMASADEEPTISHLQALLSTAVEYVLIEPYEARRLMPLLRRYAAFLDGQLATPGDPLDQMARDRQRFPERAEQLQYGEGLGWRAYCAEDLLRAFEVADAESKEVALVFI